MLDWVEKHPQSTYYIMYKFGIREKYQFCCVKVGFDKEAAKLDFGRERSALVYEGSVCWSKVSSSTLWILYLVKKKKKEKKTTTT